MGYIRRGLAKSQPLVKKCVKFSLWATFGCFAISILWVIALRWLPVYFTPLVLFRTAEYGMEGKWVKIHKDWVSIDDISPFLQKAVIASEDPKFLTHNGFDFEAIARALDANKRRKVKMGASTISQQTAKNVFLYPSRTYIRKGFEAYFTVLIETFWNKRRILEVYLNVIELGPGIYGAEGASQYFYKKSANKLSADEAHLFAAILPNPRRWNPKRPTNFVLKRRNFIRRNLALLGTRYFKPLMASVN
ncbi:MAG TPA: monofunctional biosynthetic peptidoglycan transglycosylase [Bacteriovoracaceae bacterium]|nr:monofunctional biosynthetic peptidoglycan transglycosylase [Bacteriovoracaceae bacterium]